MARHALAWLLATACAACAARAPHRGQLRQESPAHNAGESDAAARERQKSATRECQVEGGVEFHGRRRYVHGANYAWHEFGTDFGGLAAWQRGGVRGDEAVIDRELAEIAESGASVVRWWVFPELRSDGLRRDAGGGVPRLADAALADLDRALALAERHDLYLMLTLFSFDGFRKLDAASPARIPLAPIVRSRAQVEQLLTQVVGPLVRHAARGPHAHRVFAWDLFNEPEWAVSDLDRSNMCQLPGEQQLECVRYEEMRWLLERMAERVAESVEGLAEHQRPLLTVGSVSAAAQPLWASVPQDFYQVHLYQHEYAAAALHAGPLDRPVVVGEFPSWGMTASGERPARSALELQHDLIDAGFAGGLGWTYNRKSAKTDWPALAKALRSFVDRHGCRARF